MKKTALLALLLFALLNVWAQSREIKGRVIDKTTGQGLADVTVAFRGTSKAVVTDAQGNFSLLAPSAAPVELEVSLVGYGTQIVSENGNGPLTITMDKQSKSLDEVVVIGYGTVRKRDLTGSVVSVKGDEVKKVAAGNAMESVQGKIAGVDIVRTSGAAGARPAITVRGNRSINADNGPLYIVDGVQYNSYEDINPNDIESMEFLKDASSTAIYGSRGANGVVIITTKKGSSGKPKISANTYYGVSEAAGYPVP